MTAAEHNKYPRGRLWNLRGALSDSRFLLLMLISLGVFVALGISFANETAT
jgi:hypothetical protein